jgi:uncharacterized membrane protein HdeD (DUF308 family)
VDAETVLSVARRMKTFFSVMAVFGVMLSCGGVYASYYKFKHGEDWLKNLVFSVVDLMLALLCLILWQLQ